MRPLTFGRAIWVFSDKAEESCPAAGPLKTSSVAKSNVARNSIAMQCFIESPSRFNRWPLACNNRTAQTPGTNKQDNHEAVDVYSIEQFHQETDVFEMPRNHPRGHLPSLVTT